MILGVGIDLVHIPRLREALSRWGDRFTDRVFSPVEISYCSGLKDPVLAYAVRFAAKEACSKALGTGMRQGVSWKQMSVSHKSSGKPVLHLSGRAREVASALGARRWDISLSHEREYACAIVILSA